MAKRDEGGSIFDLAGKKPTLPKKKHVVPSAKKEAAPPPPPPPPPPEAAHVPTNEEIQRMIDKMHSMHQELSEKLDQAFKDRRLTPKDLEKILQVTNAKNLEQLQERVKDLENQIYGVVGEGARSLGEKRKEVKAAKKQKGKTAGSRRGWISTG